MSDLDWLLHVQNALRDAGLNPCCSKVGAALRNSKSFKAARKQWTADVRATDRVIDGLLTAAAIEAKAAIDNLS